MRVIGTIKSNILNYNAVRLQICYTMSDSFTHMADLHRVYSCGRTAMHSTSPDYVAHLQRSILTKVVPAIGRMKQMHTSSSRGTLAPQIAASYEGADDAAVLMTSQGPDLLCLKLLSQYPCLWYKIDNFCNLAPVNVCSDSGRR